MNNLFEELKNRRYPKLDREALNLIYEPLAQPIHQQVARQNLYLIFRDLYEKGFSN